MIETGLKSSRDDKLWCPLSDLVVEDGLINRGRNYRSVSFQAFVTRIGGRRTCTSGKTQRPGNAATDSKIFVLDAQLGEHDAQRDRPRKRALADEEERDHHAHVVRRRQPEQRPEEHRDGRRHHQLPLPVLDPAAEAPQQRGAEADGEALRQRQHRRVHPVGAAVGVEHGRHGRPQDAARVVEHVGDGQRQRRRGEVAAARGREDAGRRQRVRRAAVRLPQPEEDQEEEADDERRDDVRGGGGVDAGPDDAEEHGDAASGEEEDA